MTITGSGGKGDLPRTHSHSPKFRDGFDRIFGSGKDIGRFRDGDEDTSTDGSEPSEAGDTPSDEATSRHPR